MRARLELFFIGSLLHLQVTHSFLPAIPLIVPRVTRFDNRVEVQQLFVPNSPLNNSAENESERDEVKSSPNIFLEEASLQGAKKIKALSIEERTKRAMLAEAVEDEMTILEDELEELLGEDGMPLEDDLRDKVESLARQIKGLREQYQLLVSGADSLTLDLFDAQNNSDDEFGILQ
mmetsp:Transcript_3238/g.3594  ORF Transcript_3238/g.3594 Transcript_3238/m.3594 type:complete len:176 (-) Transcript_3238:276-803(-)